MIRDWAMLWSVLAGAGIAGGRIRGLAAAVIPAKTQLGWSLLRFGPRATIVRARSADSNIRHGRIALGMGAPNLPRGICDIVPSG